MCAEHSAHRQLAIAHTSNQHLRRLQRLTDCSEPTSPSVHYSSNLDSSFLPFERWQLLSVIKRLWKQREINQPSNAENIQLHLPLYLTLLWVVYRIEIRYFASNETVLFMAHNTADCVEQWMSKNCSKLFSEDVCIFIGAKAINPFANVKLLHQYNVS